MRVRIHKNWNPLQEIFQLTQDEIELQVLHDVRSYHDAYSKKYGKQAPEQFDVDNFIAERWGFEIVFDSIKQQEGEEVLGYTSPKDGTVVVDPEQCGSKERITFTVAHEAGHLALHATMFRLENGKVVDWSRAPIQPQYASGKSDRKQSINQKRMEWQANKYAGALLVPKHIAHKTLVDLGLVVGQKQIKSVDLLEHAQFLMEKFGISRQALEIRLSDLKIDLLNRRYRIE